MTKYQEISTGFVPRNNNPKIWIADQNQIAGGFHQYNSLEELVALYPEKMKKGMTAVVNEHDRSGVIFKTTTFQLATLPDLSDYPLNISPNLLDDNGNEVIPLVSNSNFYLNYWEPVNQLELIESEYAIEYSPDINGLKPSYPYIDNPSNEVFWTSIYTPGISKWYRQRRNSQIDQTTGIYINWTVPFSINGNFESGDFIQNLFRRSPVIPELPGQYTKTGLVNNDPVGWSDSIPTGSDPLYEIRAPKDKFGNLKDTWIGPFLIPENADLVRYNSQSVPNPNTLINNTTVATIGSSGDVTLITNNWLKDFDSAIHSFRAIREEISPGNYTSWVISKISEESGEFIDRIYKLFDINTDFDNITFIANNTPTGNNPTETQGWSDTRLPENNSQINCYSESRKFFDGSLKIPWSSPQPFTGESVYKDIITSNGETTFKYSSSVDQQNGTNSDPLNITLTFELYKGINEIISGITYKWFKVYDNRLSINVNPAIDTPLSTTKSLTVLPENVNGKAIFKCFAELTTESGGIIPFDEEESITDITDGDDAKSLSLSSETSIILYDTIGSTFSVDNTIIRGRQSFLEGIDFYWYKDNGSSNWIDISTDTDYTLTNQTLSIANNNLFTSDGTKENARFILTTGNSPLIAEGVDEFYDIITISKLSSLGVGAAGDNAITISLSNEVDSIILDRATLLPQNGEIGNLGRIKTLIKVFNGTNELDYGTAWTITSIVSDNTDITFNNQAGGINDREVYLDTWTNNTVRKVNATITINVIGVGDFVKNFTVSSNLDDAGALISFIQIDSTSSNQTLTFSSVNSNDIILSSKLDQNGTLILPANYDSNVLWKLNNVPIVGTGINDSLLTLTRDDITGSGSLTAQINYNNISYISTPINIDDITDGQVFILYHNFNPVPDPITIPTKPSNSTISTFTSEFNLSGTSNNTYYRNPNNTGSYFYSIGQVTQGTNTIVFSNPIRYRGEKGDQGNAATNGTNGWSSQLSLAQRNSDFVLQLNWIGGTGSTPPFDGRYLTNAGGFTTDINLAQRINGLDGNDANVSPFQYNTFGTLTELARDYTEICSPGETLGTYSFTNNTGRSRYFKINTTVKFTNDNGTERILLNLFSQQAGSPSILRNSGGLSNMDGNRNVQGDAINLSCTVFIADNATWVINLVGGPYIGGCCYASTAWAEAYTIEY